MDGHWEGTDEVEGHVVKERWVVTRCEAYSTRRRGVCDRPLDEHGNCDRASEHGEHLAEPRGDL